MRTPASIAGHPIHPMLVAIPIGLWVFSFIADWVFAANHREIWHTVAFYTMAGGVIGALLAAVPGFIDMLSLPAGTMKRTALIHMTINLTVVVLYCINLWMRRGAAAGDMGPVWLSTLTILMLLVSGWLGGKMVYKLGIAVEAPPEAAARTTTRANLGT
jgi:uncharacterized membrane protein